MSLIDPRVAAVTTAESAKDRRQARASARAAAQAGDWLSLILDHHERLEVAFAAVLSAATVPAQSAARQWLAVLLTGHAIAEESVIYPALAAVGGNSHAATAYSEQAAAKTEMALLETLTPMSPEYLDKVEQIRRAVAHHMYEEEGTWFLALKQGAPAASQAALASRYREEFTRYVNGAGPEAQRRASAGH